MKRKWTMIVAMILSVIMLCACAAPAAEPKQEAAASAPVEISGSAEKVENAVSVKDSFVVAVTSDPISLSPWQSSNNGNYAFKSAVYERLFFQNAEGEIEAGLAESWEWNEDYSALTVKLRQGVKFHNGEELKANDVVYSLQKGGAEPIITAQIDYIDFANVKAVDDYTVEIPMIYPCAIAEAGIAGCAVWIVNEKWAKENGEDFSSTACGTGPYKCMSYEPNVEMKFERFEEYWGTKAPCASFTQRVIAENSQALMELENGNIDIMLYPDKASVVDVLEGRISGAKVYTAPAIMNIACYFNLTLEPTTEKLVRQAIYYATNIDDCVAAAYYNNGTKATSMIASGAWGYTDKYITNPVYTYNPEKAKELLAQAGYADGLTITCYVANNATERITMAEVMQQNLADVGITMKIETLEYSAFRAALVDATQDNCFMFGITATTGEADNALYSRFYETMGESVGLMGWTDQPECETVSNLLTEARQTFDDDARFKIYEEVQDVLMDSVPVIPLAEHTIHSILGENVEGYEAYSEYYWVGNVYFK